jgi:hypothetical protein
MVRRHGRVDAGNSDTRTEGTTGRAEARNADEYEGPDEISNRRAGGCHSEVQGRHVLVCEAASWCVLAPWRRGGVVQMNEVGCDRPISRLIADSQQLRSIFQRDRKLLDADTRPKNNREVAWRQALECALTSSIAKTFDDAARSSATEKETGRLHRNRLNNGPMPRCGDQNTIERDRSSSIDGIINPDRVRCGYLPLGHRKVER